MVAKVEGAPEPRVRAAAVPSGTNLLGLLNHLTTVERWTSSGAPTSVHRSPDRGGAVRAPASAGR
ncbi:DUF664 domain-containing protein [Streptomyces noursei]|uniref:mycothiol transferase n=1 Tax=Streptomyces noursei TaxID=1971 RepID=UPI0035D8368C